MKFSQTSTKSASERATLAEKEVNALKEQLSTTHSKLIPDVLSGKMADCEQQTVDVIARHSVDGEVASKDKEISKLVHDIERLESSINRMQETSASQIASLEEQLEQRAQHIAHLEARLEAMHDYEQVKRELSILRALEIPTPGSNESKTLEMILAERAKLEERTESPPTSRRSPEEPPDCSSPVQDEDRPDEQDRPDDEPVVSPVARTPTPRAASVTDAYINGKLQDDCQNNNHLTQIMASPMLSNGLMLNHPGFHPRDLCDMKSSFRFEDRYRFGEESVLGRLGESLIPKGDPMEAKLQEMLRYNMDKYSTQNLDTLHIARRVRELLSIHNIGQRLFAKYVLGLSQGTVSELLSKPKPWDKLTEKGRDSYRKMHAWACDENAVLLLKSLIPKKAGKEGLPFGRDTDGPNMVTEERIAHILSEASSHMMGSKQNQVMLSEDQHNSHEEDSKSPHCPSPVSSKEIRRMKKFENDDIPQEKVARIYQEELAKLMSRGPGHAFPSLLFPHLFGAPPGSLDAIDAYHRELAKLGTCPSPSTMPGMPGLPAIGGLPGLPGLLALQQHPHQNGGAQDLSLPKERRTATPGPQPGSGPPGHKLVNGVAEPNEDSGKDQNSRDSSTAVKKEPIMDSAMAEAIRHAGSAFSLVRPKTEPDWPQTNTSGSTASSPLSNSILPPVLNPSEELVTSSAASPLQRMASITNSLISQPTVTPHHSSNQRPLKAVLPPITQQQFDMFNNLNTEDIVKRVKEQLSQYSISQRLFGESVLGLSQGSVSDLLARPKPWHMLTQKGREPFIRMKMFLEDENAVHKLVASQYKIAPEKLMRTGGYGGATINPPQLPPKHQLPPSSKHCEQLSNMAATLIQQQQQQQHQQDRERKSMEQRERERELRETILPPTMNIMPPGNPMLASSPAAVDHKKPPQHLSNMRALHQHISPSVYEMAALTQDLDTQVITTKIKEALLANNIGQKIFGEAVLGLSQGSVSELLSKPKPWHMLSIKGREPFIRMQLWLSDSHNIDRLQALKNERRELNKRRRSSGHGGGGGDNSSDTSSNDTAEFYHATSPGPAKKQRVLFSEEQKEALRLAFALDPYPNVATIEFLASELALSSRTITNWFHNHRMRLKQQVPHAEAALPRDPPTAFDPVQFRVLLNQRLLEVQKERLGLPNVPLPYPPYHLATLNLLATAAKEQLGGLDLTLKREPFDDESDLNSDDSNLSSASLKNEVEEDRAAARTSRRKPAAPQWVNPEWQEEKPKGDAEVIINGVCVMQTDEFSREKEQETIRIEPTPVMDRFDGSEESGDEQPELPRPPPTEAATELASSPTPKLDQSDAGTQENSAWEY